MKIDRDERLLVLLAQNGDKAAFESLLSRVYGPLHRYLVKLVGAAMAEDLLQEVALRVFQKIAHLRDAEAFWPWVYQIATRISFAHLEREKRWPRLDPDVSLLPAPSQDSSADHTGLAAELLSMVSNLPPASRAVFLLHYQQDLSIEETAAILSIPTGTAKSRLAYGMAKLRNLIQEKQQK